jgi:hypothetical protein
MQIPFKKPRNFILAAILTATLLLVLSPYAFGAFADSLRPFDDKSIETLGSNDPVISPSIQEMNFDLCLQTPLLTVVLEAAADDNGDDEKDEAQNGEDTEKKDEDTSEPRNWDAPKLG